MKIKYQSGGVVSYTPFIPQSGGATTSGSSGSTEKADKITGTLQKEIIDVLKENGLQSDVDNFLSQANSFLASSQNLSTMSLFGGEDDKYTMSHLIGILSMANKVKQNKAQYDLATDKLKAENAWNEVAVASNGYLYVIDANHKMSTISAEEFHKNRDKYQALTNSQVLGLREQDPNLAYRSDILKDAAGAIGMKTISDQLVEVVNKFGTTTRNEYIKNTGEQISQSAWDGMQILIGNGPQGYYKATTKSERENVQSALSYLWRTLGADGQKRLRAETVINGGDPNKNQYDLLMEVLQHHTDYERTVDFDSSASNYDPDGDGKGSDPGSALTEGTLAMEVARGNLTETTAYMSPVAQRVSDKSMMAFKAWNAGQLQDKQGDILHANNLQDLIPKISQAKSADTSTVVFGNQLLTNEQIAGVVWDGSSLATRVALPKKYVNGKQVPDFDLMTALNELNGWIKDNPGVTNLEIQQKMQNLAYEGVYFDPNTQSYQIDPDKMGFFLSFAAYGSDDLMDIKDESKPFLQKLTRREGKALKTQFNNLVHYGNLTPNRKDKQKNDLGSSEANDFYYGNIYIPIVDPMQATMTTREQLYPKSMFVNSPRQNELGQQILQNQQQSNWTTNF